MSTFSEAILPAQRPATTGIRSETADRFALDRMTQMTPDDRRHLIRNLNLYISVGHRQSLLDYHDRVLELQGKEKWRVRPAADCQKMVAAT